VAIIIPNLISGPWSSRLHSKRATFPARRKIHRETFPSTPGSINTVGQALAQLSSSTSDSALPKRYDLSGSFGKPTFPSDRLAHPKFAGNQLSVSTEEHSHEVEVRHISASSDLLFRMQRPRPAAVVSLVCDTFFATFPASLARKATIHKKNRSLLSAHFFHANQKRFS
jgi:hypothetical protein